jgi:hypothetical protein
MHFFSFIPIPPFQSVYVPPIATHSNRRTVKPVENSPFFLPTLTNKVSGNTDENRSLTQEGDLFQDWQDSLKRAEESVMAQHAQLQEEGGLLEPEYQALRNRAYAAVR